MEKKNYKAVTKRQQISEFIYKNGVNTSSRDRTTPRDNEKIEESSLVSIINFGVDLDNGVMSLRAKFHGSNTFYSISFDNSKYEDWVRRIKELHRESNVDIDNEDDDLDF